MKKLLPPIVVAFAICTACTREEGNRNLTETNPLVHRAFEEIKAEASNDSQKRFVNYEVSLRTEGPYTIVHFAPKPSSASDEVGAGTDTALERSIYLDSKTLAVQKIVVPQ